ncbi:antitoxin [Geminocystis sp.]|uniref:antitoxin n=1 Tax=Geminocystis sp. TaxID=2664100 RepID=UPI0035943579
MLKEYHVKLIQQGNIQTLTIPKELKITTSSVIIHQEDDKLIIEPLRQKSLLKVLSTLEPLEEDFPDIDEGLLPLDDIEI